MQFLRGRFIMKNAEIEKYMTVRLNGTLPPSPSFVEGIRRAPRREANLSEGERATALKNALRYIPEEYHEQLAPILILPISLSLSESADLGQTSTQPPHEWQTSSKIINFLFT
jgi:hypothetical protein